MLYPLLLPTDKDLYYFPNKVWEALTVSIQYLFRTPPLMLKPSHFFTFVAHVFHYNRCANSSAAVAVTCAWKNLHPPFPKQFIVITLIAGKAIFFPYAHTAVLNTSSLLQVRARKPKQ